MGEDFIFRKQLYSFIQLFSQPLFPKNFPRIFPKNFPYTLKTQYPTHFQVSIRGGLRPPGAAKPPTHIIPQPLSLEKHRIPSSNKTSPNYRTLYLVISRLASEGGRRPPGAAKPPTHIIPQPLSPKNTKKSPSSSSSRVFYISTTPVSYSFPSIPLISHLRLYTPPILRPDCPQSFLPYSSQYGPPEQDARVPLQA